MLTLKLEVIQVWTGRPIDACAKMKAIWKSKLHLRKIKVGKPALGITWHTNLASAASSFCILWSDLWSVIGSAHNTYKGWRPLFGRCPLSMWKEVTLYLCWEKWPFFYVERSDPLSMWKKVTLYLCWEKWPFFYVEKRDPLSMLREVTHFLCREKWPFIYVERSDPLSMLREVTLFLCREK